MRRLAMYYWSALRAAVPFVRSAWGIVSGLLGLSLLALAGSVLADGAVGVVVVFGTILLMFMVGSYNLWNEAESRLGLYEGSPAFSLFVRVDEYRVYVGVENRGPTAEFEAQVAVATGGIDVPPVPWGIRWRDHDGRRCQILHGQSQLLHLVNLDSVVARLNRSIWGHRGFVVFLTPTGPLTAQVASSEKVQPLNLRIVVSSVTPERSIEKPLRILRREDAPVYSELVVQEP